ncbi:MAG: DUF4340 domain-containing protein [Candidatus Brocadiales bacterium]|nr:DUF4340 domain-containing protein [Candidatus Brocadiales bacterium]
MRLKTTLVLLGIVLVLGLFVQFYEKKRPSTEEWQEQASKVFLQFDSKRVTGLEIKKEDGVTLLERIGEGRWEMKLPLKLRADDSEVNSILTEFEFLTKGATIGPEKGASVDLASYGLDKPHVEASYWTSPSKADKRTFFVGSKRVGGNEVYMRVEGGKEVYMVSGALLEKLTKTMNDLRSKDVVEVDPNAVERLELQYPAGETILCSRTGENWRLEEPVSDQGDSEKIMQVIHNLNALRIDKNDFITDKPEDLSKFGLDNPQVVATVYKGDSSQGLLLGHRRDNKVYAKRKDDAAVFFLKDMTVGLFEKSHNELRDKKLARFDPLYVTKFELRARGSVMSIEKTEQYDYMVLKPVQVMADRDAFKGFLEAIKGLEVQNFVADKPTELASYGLDSPQAEIVITIKDVPKPIEIQVGKKDERGYLCYVKRAGEAPVFSVKAEKFYEPATQGYLAFRDRLVIEFNRDKAKRLMLERKDKRFTAEKTSDPKEIWELSEPVKVETDEEIINNIIWSLSFLKADGYVAENPESLAPYGLDAPRIKATIAYEKEQPKETEEKGTLLLTEKEPVVESKTLLIGNKVKEGENENSYAMMQGGNLVFLLSWTDVRYLESELASKMVMKFDSEGVTRVSLNYPDKEVLYEKKGEIWEMVKPEQKQITSKEVDTILYSLKNLKAEDIAQYTSGNLAEFELDKPSFKIALTTKEGEKVLALGKETEKDRYFLKASDSEFIFLVSKENVEKLKTGRPIVDLKGVPSTMGEHGGATYPPMSGGHGGAPHPPMGGGGHGGAPHPPMGGGGHGSASHPPMGGGY